MAAGLLAGARRRPRQPESRLGGRRARGCGRRRASSCRVGAEGQFCEMTKAWRLAVQQCECTWHQGAVHCRGGRHTPRPQTAETDGFTLCVFYHN